MTRDQIDQLWSQALQQAVKDGEEYTRYHFANLVMEAACKECVEVCDEIALDTRRICLAENTCEVSEK